MLTRNRKVPIPVRKILMEVLVPWKVKVQSVFLDDQLKIITYDVEFLGDGDIFPMLKKLSQV